jgi:hypothetical protein
MSIPTLDLDMNLASPTCGIAGGFVSADTRISDDSGISGSVQLLSSAFTNAAVEKSAPNNNFAAAENTTVRTTGQTVEESETIEEETVADFEQTKKTNNVEEMMDLVESWRDEINMMSVKNAISLDDLVTVGADI